MFIEELDLSVRLYNFCKRNGVDTWADLAGVSVQDLNSWTHPTGSAVGLRVARELVEVQRYIARAVNPSREWTDEQADLLAAAAVTAGHYPPVVFECTPDESFGQAEEFALGLGELDAGGF